MSGSNDDAKVSGSDRTQNAEKTSLEIAKLRLEIGKLERDRKLSGRAASTLTPLITAFVAILGVVLSLYTLHQQGQARTEESNEKAFQQALSMATDPKGSADRRISGIYQLRKFWDGKQQVDVIAATLAALVTVPDTVPDGPSIRCAAVSAIRDAFRRAEDTSRKSMLMNLFFSRTVNRHEIGDALITTPNRMLAKTHSSQKQLERFGTDDQFAEVRNCSTPISATKAAIQQFKSDLNGLFLSLMNLDSTNLIAANLHNAELNVTSMRGALLHCANFAEADLKEMRLDGARVGFMNIYKADIWAGDNRYSRETLINKGAIEISDAQWREWQKSDFDGSILKKILGGTIPRIMWENSPKVIETAEVSSFCRTFD
jgi:hypothetical protein